MENYMTVLDTSIPYEKVLMVMARKTIRKEIEFCIIDFTFFLLLELFHLPLLFSVIPLLQIEIKIGKENQEQ